MDGCQKNLKCILFFSFQAIPEASISWKYKETDINNGSTLVNDIDMRYYFYIETGFGSNRKSELFLSATSVDDNGTFACIAENKAGKARAEFKLHVVVPMPPKPPQVITYINTQEFYIQYIAPCGMRVRMRKCLFLDWRDVCWPKPSKNKHFLERVHCTVYISTV